jgi:hypothetical protein
MLFCHRLHACHWNRLFITLAGGVDGALGWAPAARCSTRTRMCYAVSCYMLCYCLVMQRSRTCVKLAGGLVGALESARSASSIMSGHVLPGNDMRLVLTYWHACHSG